MTTADGGLAARPGLVLARAKVNLYLHVTGRRPNGYHLLDSLVVFAEIGDLVEVRPADAFTLRVTGPFADEIPAGDDNLVLRAARGLAAAFGIADRAEIALDKRLPVAAGIGGGSADAAATLRALAELWRLDVADRRCADLAVALGADVPMCLAGRPAFVGGIGEEIEPLPAVPDCGLVLVNPRRPLPTPAVFAARDGAFSAPARFAPPADVAAFARLLAERRNDLAAAAAGIVPEVGDVLAELAATPGVLLARMSGSGATCFGLCADASAADVAAADLRRRRGAWWIEAASVAGGGASA